MGVSRRIDSILLAVSDLGADVGVKCGPDRAGHPRPRLAARLSGKFNCRLRTGTDRHGFGVPHWSAGPNDRAHPREPDIIVGVLCGCRQKKRHLLVQSTTMRPRMFFADIKRPQSPPHLSCDSHAPFSHWEITNSVTVFHRAVMNEWTWHD